jgi:hypothetical protein
VSICYIIIQFIENDYIVNDVFCNANTESIEYYNGQQTLQECSYRRKNWTLLVTVNNGFFDMFLNWRWYFKKLNISNPLFVIAEDAVVFKRLLELKDNAINVMRSEIISINKSVEYDSSLYNKMVSARPTYILWFLRRGVNLIYADIDSVWLKNPLFYLEGDFDILGQLDSKHNLCTGFLAILNSQTTIEVIRKWKDALSEKEVVNQPTFNWVVRKSSVNIKSLDSRMFPSGKLYFEEFSKAERLRVVIVHNNWIAGHDKKVERFKNMSLWAHETVN